jgi:nicotinate-nucleotide pyrophosphorylase (carboxylating)
MNPTPAEVRRIVDMALAEDAPWGDITSETLVPPRTRIGGAMVARAAGVVAGLPFAEATFAAVDPGISFRPSDDGAAVEPGTRLAGIEGDARNVLRAERVALNLVQRLSGIATLTADYVRRIDGTGARIVDTRKTTPGLRSLERYAVRMGGGRNHRTSLSDAVLVKDNHLVALAASGVGIADALRQARDRLPHTTVIEVEVDSLDQVEAALDGGADVILIDNFTPEEAKEAVARIAGRALVEASGGINLSTVRAMAEAGVDVISVGALTHSAPALDIALDLEIT